LQKARKLLLKNKLLVIKILPFILVPLTIIIFLLSIFDKQEESKFIKGEMKKFVLSEKSTKNIDIFWFDLNNRKISLNNNSGKVVLVNFWASWCAPCINELPSINRLSSKLNKSKFESVLINIDKKNKKKSIRIFNSLKLNNLEYFYDMNNYLVSNLKVEVIPTTIIYNQNGQEIGRFFGEANWSSSDAINLINYYIK